MGSPEDFHRKKKPLVFGRKWRSTRFSTMKLLIILSGVISISLAGSPCPEDVSFGNCTCYSEGPGGDEAQGETEMYCDGTTQDELNTVTLLWKNLTLALDTVVIKDSSIVAIPNNTFDGIDVTNLMIDQAPLWDFEVNSFSGMPSIKEIMITRTNLATIPGHLDVSRTLSLLDFSRNKILRIKSDDFEALSSVTELILSNNFISEIGEKAFEPLVELNSLIMDGNKLGTVSGTWFANNKKLKYIAMSGCNISIILPNFFDNIKGLHELDMSDNNVARLYKATFEVFISNKNELLVNGNPLICDQSMCWLGKYLQSHIDGNEQIEGKCLEPEKLESKPLHELNEEVLNCNK